MTETFISSKLRQLKLCNSIIKVESLTGGCISNAMCYSTDTGDFFVKTNSSKKAPQWFLAESLALERIYKAVPGFVPKPIYYSKNNEEQSYIITEYISMKNKSSSIIQKELGKKLAQLHLNTRSEDKFGFDVTSFCGTTELNNAWCSDWSLFFKSQRLQPLFNQVLGQNKDLDMLGIQLCQSIDHWLGSDVLPNVQPSLLHGDLWNGNWSVKTHGGPVIFDPASYYGHHESEFGIMNMFGGFTKDCFNAYDDTMNNDTEGREDRLILYEIYHHLNHFAMFGGSYGNSCVQLMERLL